MKTLIIYYSGSGNTERMSQEIAKGASKKSEVILKKVDEAAPEDLLEADVIILGSPCYFGNMCWQMKKFIDETTRIHGKLRGKRGGCFASAGSAKDGKETLLALRRALEVHGLEVVEGPLSTGVPSEDIKEKCREYGEAIAT